MNRRILIVSALIIAVGATVMSIVVQKSGKSAVVQSVTTQIPLSTKEINSSPADWASKAVTVNDLVLEADLVVRARVSEAPITRVLDIEAPVMDENGNTTHSITIQMLVSDSVFEVLHTYKGKPLSKITVRQSGGFNQSVSKGIEERVDDPLYKVEEEYILFLVDASSSSGFKLYYIVNPYGRYKIDGENVFSYGENLIPEAVSLPLTVNDLEIEIEHAITFLPTPTDIFDEIPVTPSGAITPNP